MPNIRAASRYAKSLLELAEEKGVLEEVYADMRLFTEVCKQNHDFPLMLNNPVIKHDKKRAILRGVFKGRVNDLTMSIFDIITKKNREPIMPAIATEFCNQYNILKNIGEASVTTSVPLTARLRAEMEAMVRQISGKESVDLTEKVDEDIIGGFILKVGDKQIDNSVRTKLKVLENEFSQDEYKKEI